MKFDFACVEYQVTYGVVLFHIQVEAKLVHTKFTVYPEVNYF